MTSFALRPYQAEAATAALAFSRAGEHPVVSLPTGAGKSLVVARLAADLRDAGPIVVTVPSRELAEQNEQAAHRFLPPEDVGVVCAIYGQPQSWFTCQPYQIGVADLVEQGYLAPVRYVRPSKLMTTRGVSRSAGDFNQRELAEANSSHVDGQARITLAALTNRRKAMVFAVTVDHAKAFRDAFQRRGEAAALIVGAMPAAERIAEVEAFRTGAARVAITVSAGLTGFDVPDIDVLACCRPTMSPIIHTQSIGRGTRPFPGKSELLALDFAGNVRMFGPVHEPHFDRSGQPLGGVAPWQACESCGTYNAFGEPACLHCGGLMPPTRAVTALDLEFGKIDWRPEMRAVQERVNEIGWRRLPVESIALHAYRKKGDPDSISCMVSLGLGGKAIVRSWFKQLYGPRWQAFWLMLLGKAPPPRSLQEALARRGELIRPASIDLELDERFWRVTGVDYADDSDDDAQGVDGAAELERV